jgi:hypothetical protein
MSTKNLVIHDFSPSDWEKISGDYAGWNVVSDNGSIHPCIGCFSCWNRTPGICAIHDGYENMGSLIHQAGDIVAEPFAFPRRLYVWIANTNWNRTSRKNGIKPEDMFTRDI